MVQFSALCYLVLFATCSAHAAPPCTDDAVCQGTAYGATTAGVGLLQTKSASQKQLMEEDQGEESEESEDVTGEESEEDEDEVYEDMMRSDDVDGQSSAEADEQEDMQGESRRRRRRRQPVKEPEPLGTDRVFSFSNTGVDNSYELTPPSCKEEKGLKSDFVNYIHGYRPKKADKKARDMDHGRKLAPSLIRAVFHDSTDKDNLMARDEDGTWSALTAPNNGSSYGGVDGCLYSALDHHGKPDPTHNRNIGASVHMVRKYCEKLCARPSSEFVEGLCKSPARCAVDMMVLGSITSIEEAGGPKIAMSWGRTKGSCDRMVVTPFTAGCRHGRCGHYVNFPALGFALPKDHMDKPEKFRETFDKMGYSAIEQTALMGAHTFGKGSSRACNALLHGPLCNKPDMLSPPLTAKNLEGCQAKYGKFTKCWKKVPCGRTLCNGDAKTLGKFRYAPVGAVMGGRNKTGFAWRGGMGAVFDRTPEKFDNDYYKLFAGYEHGLKNTCCGNRRKDSQCTHLGAMQTRDEGKKVKGGSCAVDWCRSDRKNSEHMKATKAWAEVHPDFVRYGTAPTRRIVRFAGDWALLAADETKDAVHKFADDQDAWFTEFAKAYEKVTRVGTATLRSCTGNE